MSFSPFADATASTQLDHLTFENQGDRLSIYGSIQITQDQAGLALLKQLQTIIQQAVKTLDGMQLPDKIATPDAAEEVDNPFK